MWTQTKDSDATETKTRMTQMSSDKMTRMLSETNDSDVDLDESRMLARRIRPYYGSTDDKRRDSESAWVTRIESRQGHRVGEHLGCMIVTRIDASHDSHESNRNWKIGTHPDSDTTRTGTGIRQPGSGTTRRLGYDSRPGFRSNGETRVDVM